MPTLLFSIAIPLERHDFDDFGRLHGPVFHRWLPNGESDSISIKTKSRDVSINVWFERCGFVKHGFIEFDYKKRQIDPIILKRQAKLDAGPLRVKIEIRRVTKNDIVTLEKNKQGDKNYQRIGKRLIKTINESIIPFINILRFYYGQYWLQELKKWNSKDESLGTYFRGIYAKYSIDKGLTWNDFIPDKLEQHLRLFSVIGSRFNAYMSEKDWRELDNTDFTEFKITLALKLLQTAHQLKDEENYKQAIIEGNTSLEVAMGELFKNRLSLSKELKEEMQSFWQLPPKAQLIVISSLIKGLSSEDIENSIDIIKIRNKIVHEGFSHKNDLDIKKKLDSFFTIISKIISSKSIKFPSAGGGNTLFSE